MAGRLRGNITSRSSFTDDPQLRQYFLDGVCPTGKELGRGSYGVVVEVKYQHTIAAAKGLHELLLESRDQGIPNIIKKYQQECQLMASVCHPHVTLFLGLCFVEEARLPLLVMERLEMSLDELVQGAPNITLKLKLSLLHDTCSGLVHLHSRQPTIVHRDLTARNVLISSSMSAKIADFGCSRMIDMTPGQAVHTMSMLPGTPVYMPPEALDNTHCIYGPSLDVFSFGHLSLYAITQVFPGELLSSTYLDPNNTENILARTEVARRQPYMTTLETQVAQSHPVLLELVRQCLHNAPERRPSSVEVLDRLQQVKVVVKERNRRTTEQLDIDKDQVIKEMLIAQEQVEADKQQISIVNQAQLGEIARLVRICDQLQAQNDQTMAEKRQLERVMENQYETDKVQLENERKQLETVKLQKQQLEIDLSNTRKELERSSEPLEDSQHQLPLKIDEVNTLESRDVKEDVFVTFLPQFKWRSGPDMPFSMSGYIQSVEVDGTVYVGGGKTHMEKYRYIVMAYNTHSFKWHTLPSYSARGFAMTTINNQLVLVGGDHEVDGLIDQLGMWQTDSKEWTRPFPRMPTPRFSPSATSHKQWLIVAGGYDGGSLSTVEVLDVENKQWSTGLATPKPWHYMKSTIIGDTWYLMGGVSGATNFNDVYSASLDSLVSTLAPNDLSNNEVWKQISGHKHYSSSPLNIGCTLLAIGGYIQDNGTPVSGIHCYVPDKWVVGGNLPCGLHSFTCIVISDRLHVFGGHDGVKRVPSTYICTATGSN